MLIRESKFRRFGNKMPKSISHLVGLSWDEFDFSTLDEGDQDFVDQEDGSSIKGTNQTSTSEEDGSSIKGTNQTSTSEEELSRIPDNLTYLFGRYPMDEDFAVTTCNYCNRIMNTAHMERHVDECENIPQELKDELIILCHWVKRKGVGLTAKGPRPGTSTGGQTRPTSISTRPLAQAAVLEEISQHSQPVPSPPVISVSKSSSSAPSSPYTGSHSPIPIPTIPTTNYTLKLLDKNEEKSDSHGVISDTPKGKSTSARTLASLNSTKNKQSLLDSSLAPPKKQSVVLKIKGNTSTTTTNEDRITLHAAPLSQDLFAQDSKSSVTTVAQVPFVALPVLSESQEERPMVPKVTAVGMTLTKGALKAMDVGDSGGPLAKKKRLGAEDARKVIPLKERRFNPNEHCGVLNTDGNQCKRSLTCKTHSMGLRRAVPGRSHPFDTLIATQKQARDKAKLAIQDQIVKSPPSPLIGTSPIVVSVSSVSSNEGSSDASRLSVSVTAAPAISTLTTLSHNSQSQLPNVTLQSLLNDASFLGEDSGTGQLSQTVLASQCQLHSGNVLNTEKKKLKNYQVQKRTESGHSGLKLYLVAKEAEGFDYLTQIIPPEDEGTKDTDESLHFETPTTTAEGKNILEEEVEEELNYVSVPLIAIPLGRRKKKKWRKSNSTSQLTLRHQGPTEDRFGINHKKFRRDEETMEKLSALVLGDGDWSAEPLSDTITLSRGDVEDFGTEELRGTGTLGQSALLQSQKVSFRIQGKRLCRPSHTEKRTASQEVTIHVGPLMEMTQSLNGVVPNDIAGKFENMEISFEAGGQGVQQKGINPVMSYEENVRSWGTTTLIEQVRNRDVDAPVADSELSKLLAAQFEDY